MPGSEYEQFRTGALGIPPYRSLVYNRNTDRVMLSTGRIPHTWPILLRETANRYPVNSNIHTLCNLFLLARSCQYVAHSKQDKQYNLLYRLFAQDHRWFDTSPLPADIRSLYGPNKSPSLQFRTDTFHGMYDYWDSKRGCLSIVVRNSFRTFRNIMLRMLRPTQVRK
jgi:hypothetical protein